MVGITVILFTGVLWKNINISGAYFFANHAGGGNKWDSRNKSVDSAEVIFDLSRYIKKMQYV